MKIWENAHIISLSTILENKIFFFLNISHYIKPYYLW